MNNIFALFHRRIENRFYRQAPRRLQDTVIVQSDRYITNFGSSLFIDQDGNIRHDSAPRYNFANARNDYPDASTAPTVALEDDESYTQPVQLRQIFTLDDYAGDYFNDTESKSDKCSILDNATTGHHPTSCRRIGFTLSILSDKCYDHCFAHQEEKEERDNEYGAALAHQGKSSRMLNSVDAPHDKYYFDNGDGEDDDYVDQSVSTLPGYFVESPPKRLLQSKAGTWMIHVSYDAFKHGPMTLKFDVQRKENGSTLCLKGYEIMDYVSSIFESVTDLDSVDFEVSCDSLGDQQATFTVVSTANISCHLGMILGVAAAAVDNQTVINKYYNL